MVKITFTIRTLGKPALIKTPVALRDKITKGYYKITYEKIEDD